MADKVSNQTRNQLSSPSLHLWADRSIQEDTEDAEGLAIRRHTIFAGVCCHMPHRPCSQPSLSSHITHFTYLQRYRHHELWDKSSFEPSLPTLITSDADGPNA